MILFSQIAGLVKEKYTEVSYSTLNRDHTQKCCRARRELKK